MPGMFRALLAHSVLFAFLLAAQPAEAQRTGDHIVPAIETVCDGDPFSFGLCNAYCEALDCDSDTPLGTPRACSNILRNYMKKSDGAAPPCSCPCDFDVGGDFAQLVELANEEIDLSVEDVDATFNTYCANEGPDGEFTFVAEAEQVVGELNTPQGVRLFYWIGDDPAACNTVGGGYDGAGDGELPNHFSYGPFITRQELLTGGQAVGCRSALEYLCPRN